MSFALLYALGESRRIPEEKKLDALECEFMVDLREWRLHDEWRPRDIDDLPEVHRELASYAGTMRRMLSNMIDAFVQGETGAEPSPPSRLDQRGQELYATLAARLNDPQRTDGPIGIPLYALRHRPRASTSTRIQPTPR